MVLLFPPSSFSLVMTFLPFPWALPHLFVELSSSSPSHSSVHYVVRFSMDGGRQFCMSLSRDRVPSTGGISPFFSGARGRAALRHALPLLLCFILCYYLVLLC
jgi:hypothetical protein